MSEPALQPDSISWIVKPRPAGGGGLFQRILDQIRSGDTIVVWRLDRLGRSTRDLLNTMDRTGAGREAL